MIEYRIEQGSQSSIEIGKKLFQWRDYTPIPLIVLLLIFSDPELFTVTLGLILIMAGELFRIYSVSFIGGVSRTRTSSTGQRLVTSGPFGLVRNPLYVGNFFITLGFAVFGGVVWIMILAILMFAFQYYYVVKYEESLLLEKFGDEYKAYLETVPAWIPRSLPSLEAIEWPETFSPAIKSEKRTLTAIAALLVVLLLVS